MSEQITTTTKLPLAKQLALTTGKQDCTCLVCDHKMSATVGGVKRDSNFQSYRPFKGTCRGCGTMFSGILRLRVY